jgi:hypothetical protein
VNTNGHARDLQPPLPDELVEQLVAANLGEIPRPVRWKDLDSDEAEPVWRDLAAFVSWLGIRYALDKRELPRCWWRHGALIEELTALKGAWEVAYDPTQAASAMADWHRTLYETRIRMSEWAARTNCNDKEHRPDQIQRWLVGPTGGRWIDELLAEAQQSAP